MTCAATIAVASGITGFTLPGMMLLPGCSAGRAISPRPASGPLFIQRRSLAIFMRLTASTFSCPDSSTAVSCADMRLEVVARWARSASPVSRRQLGAEALPELRMRIDAGADRGAALRQRAAAAARTACRRAMPFSICVRQPDSSCDSVTGIASIRCVRPVLTMSATSCSLALQRLAQMLERRQQLLAAAAAPRSRGSPWESTSLLLWPMLT